MRHETANGITANIVRVLSLQGAFVTRINTVGIWDAAKGIHRTTNQRKGVPDIIACYRGKLIGVEVKAGKDKQSDDQKVVQFEIEKAGGIYLIARSTDDFIKWFQDHINSK